MSGSTIEYNGVTIHDVSLQTIDQTPQYDPTGVDPIYIRTTLTCTGVVHLDGAATAPDLGVEVSTLGDMQSQVLTKLTNPRREFKFYFGSAANLLLHVVPSATKPSVNIPKPSSAFEDLNHGPRPQVVVNRVRGDRSAKITFRVELATWDCDGGLGDANGVTNLRYYAIDDIDENWATTRTIRGRMRVKNKDIDMHALRGFLLPPLQGGFRRTQMRFSESPNGLELEFEIRDVEEHASPPKPATKWSARYDVTTNNGAFAVCGMQVQLEGPPRGSRKALLQLAMRIIDAKLDVLSRLSDGSFRPVVIEHASFSEQLEANKVQAVMRIKKFPRDGRDFKFFNIVAENLGDPMPSDVQEGGGYDPHVYSFPDPQAPLTGLFYSALQDPCEPTGLSSAQMSVSISDPVGEAPGVVEDEDGTLGDDYINELNQEAQSIYTDYKMSSEYSEDVGYSSLPVAQTSDGSTDPVMFRMHMGLPIREVVVEAERIGKWPTIPKPVATFVDSVTGVDIRHTLKKYKLTSVTPKLSPDGVNFIYRVQMYICWNLGKRIDPDDANYWAGAFPYDQSTVETNLLPASMFSDPEEGFRVQ